MREFASNSLIFDIFISAKSSRNLQILSEIWGILMAMELQKLKKQIKLELWAKSVNVCRSSEMRTLVLVLICWSVFMGIEVQSMLLHIVAQLIVMLYLVEYHSIHEVVEIPPSYIIFFKGKNTTRRKRTMRFPGRRATELSHRLKI